MAPQHRKSKERKEKEKEGKRDEQQEDKPGSTFKERHLLKIQLALALAAFLVSIGSRLMQGHDRYNFVDSYKDPIAWYRQFAKEYTSLYEMWGYSLHVNVTARLEQLLSNRPDAVDPSVAKILDVGTAAGLVGLELRRLGFQHITGIDVVPEILAEANATGAYASVMALDAESVPIEALHNASFDAVTCVGTLGYLGRGEQDDRGPALDHSRAADGPEAEAPRVEKLLKEWLRLLKPGGFLALTAEILLKRPWEVAFDRLEQAGELSQIEMSGPFDFLPLNGHKWTSEQKVHMFFLQKQK